MDTFSDWLRAELASRDWSQADLARYAHVSPTQIANVLSGKRGPGEKLCNGIAKAFNLEPRKVFERAGLMHPSGITKLDDLDARIMAITTKLPESLKADLAEYAEMLRKRVARKGSGERGDSKTA